MGPNIETGEKNYLHMSDTCTIHPVTDDMAICHPSFQNGSGKLALYDGEDGWFLRVDGITEYGSDPMYERITIHSQEPLVFFNIQGVPTSTCLVWEHTLDSDGTPCPNPRVIVPRKMVDNIVKKPVEVDVRSFGVRMPPTTAANPDYGIMGLMHIIPPALAWLWRLVAPRGFKNPSISGNSPLASEGVGSYWPFATGLKVKQANLLLEQILSCPNTKYCLLYTSCPYNPIMTQQAAIAAIQCCGHGKQVQTPDGRWFMVYLCSRFLEGEWGMLGRETCLDEITWTSEGWPLRCV